MNNDVRMSEGKGKVLADYLISGINPTDGQESGIIYCSIPGLGRFRCDNGWLAPVYLHYLIKNKGASGINSQETTKKAIR